jgi:hypothetical protein
VLKLIQRRSTDSGWKRRLDIGCDHLVAHLALHADVVEDHPSLLGALLAIGLKVEVLQLILLYLVVILLKLVHFIQKRIVGVTDHSLELGIHFGVLLG